MKAFQVVPCDPSCFQDTVWALKDNFVTLNLNMSLVIYSSWQIWSVLLLQFILFVGWCVSLLFTVRFHGLLFVRGLQSSGLLLPMWRQQLLREFPAAEGIWCFSGMPLSELQFRLPRDWRDALCGYQREKRVPPASMEYMSFSLSW